MLCIFLLACLFSIPSKKLFYLICLINSNAANLKTKRFFCTTYYFLLNISKYLNPNEIELI